MSCILLWQLEEVNWRQNLTMAQSGRSKLKQPNALFEFVIKEGEVSVLLACHMTADSMSGHV